MGLDGVVAADVSFDKAQAIVKFDPERVSNQDLIGAVDGAGFQAHLIGHQENR